MPSSYSPTKPYTSPKSSQQHIKVGRGGAGNIITKPPINFTQSINPHDNNRISPSHPSTKPFITGRGGAGNMHSPSEYAIFSFDEELERELRLERNLAPVYCVSGRGGVGNITTTTNNNVGGGYARGARLIRPNNLRRDGESSKSSTTTMSSSVESGADFATRKIVQGWKKITS